jgi:hypothetical protein
MSGVPTNIKIETVIKLCELYGHGQDIVELVLFLEDIAYPLRFPPKDS